MPSRIRTQTETGKLHRNAINTPPTTPQPSAAPSNRASLTSPIPIQERPSSCGIMKASAARRAASVHSSVRPGNSTICPANTIPAAGTTIRLGITPRWMSITDRMTNTAAANAATTALSSGSVAKARITTPATSGAVAAEGRSSPPPVSADGAAAGTLPPVTGPTDAPAPLIGRFDRREKVPERPPLGNHRKVGDGGADLVGHQHDADRPLQRLDRRARGDGRRLVVVKQDHVDALPGDELRDASGIGRRGHRAVPARQQEGDHVAEVGVRRNDQNAKRLTPCEQA